MLGRVALSQTPTRHISLVVDGSSPSTDEASPAPHSDAGSMSLTPAPTDDVARKLRAVSMALHTHADASSSTVAATHSASVAAAWLRSPPLPAGTPPLARPSTMERVDLYSRSPDPRQPVVVMEINGDTSSDDDDDDVGVVRRRARSPSRPRCDAEPTLPPRVPRMRYRASSPSPDRNNISNTTHNAVLGRASSTSARVEADAPVMAASLSPFQQVERTLSFSMQRCEQRIHNNNDDDHDDGVVEVDGASRVGTLLWSTPKKQTNKTLAEMRSPYSSITLSPFSDSPSPREPPSPPVEVRMPSAHARGRSSSTRLSTISSTTDEEATTSSLAKRWSSVPRRQKLVEIVVDPSRSIPLLLHSDDVAADVAHRLVEEHHIINHNMAVAIQRQLQDEIDALRADSPSPRARSSSNHGDGAPSSRQHHQHKQRVWRSSSSSSSPEPRAISLTSVASTRTTHLRDEARRERERLAREAAHVDVPTYQPRIDARSARLVRGRSGGDEFFARLSTRTHTMQAEEVMHTHHPKTNRRGRRGSLPITRKVEELREETQTRAASADRAAAVARQRDASARRTRSHQRSPSPLMPSSSDAVHSRAESTASPSPTDSSTNIIISRPPLLNPPQRAMRHVDERASARRAPSSSTEEMELQQHCSFHPSINAASRALLEKFGERLRRSKSSPSPSPRLADDDVVGGVVEVAERRHVDASLSAETRCAPTLSTNASMLANRTWPSSSLVEHAPMHHGRALGDLPTHQHTSVVPPPPTWMSTSSSPSLLHAAPPAEWREANTAITRDARRHAAVACDDVRGTPRGSSTPNRLFLGR